MTNEPEDRLEDLFAAEEAAIRDDGFSQRVLETAGRSSAWRRTAIYGAGMAGAGMAVGGIVEMAPYMPNMTGWIDQAAAAVRSADVAASLQGASDATLLAIAAVVAGVSFLVAAVAIQAR